MGLNGSAYTDGLAVMPEIGCGGSGTGSHGIACSRGFLRCGVTTVPEYLAKRFDRQTQSICTLIFLSAYALILLPIILYTGATGLIGILMSRRCSVSNREQ